MPIASSSALLEALRQFRLLEEPLLDQLTRELRANLPEPRALARELVKRGWLTPYQVNALFRGRGHELLLGSYVVLDKLGEGGMGAVFKARNWKLGRVVAVKLIRKERLVNPDLVRRFRREIRAAAQLAHPNIVHAHDADEVDGTHFMVLEYVEGRDLARHVEQAGPLPVALACEVVRQAAEGLQHAHERGLTHRDIKPSNLLLTRDGQVKVLDMGLARLETGDSDGQSSGPLTQEGVVMGTPDFVAPEQALDPHGADIRADLYSLGCTLYFLLARRVPFPGSNLTTKLVMHQKAEPNPIEAIRPDVPPAVAHLVRKLMAKRPEDRYQTPGEVAAVLAALLAGGGCAAVAPAAVPSVSFRPQAGAETPVSPFTVLDTLSTDEEGSAQRRQRQAVERRRLRMWLVGGGGVCLVLALAALAGLLVAVWWAADAPRGGDVVTSFRAEANRPWQDAGVDVPAGARVALSARGRWEKKGQPACSGEGLREAPRDRAVLPDAPALCLLARLGDAEPVAVKMLGSLEAPADARLFVQANDLDLGENSGSLEVQIQGGRRAGRAAAAPAPSRIEAAEAAVVALLARAASPTGDWDRLRDEATGLRLKYPGTSQARRLGTLLTRLPSPLDRLDPAGLPAEERYPWQPKEMVAVLGEHRGRQWAPVRSLAYSPDGRVLASGGDDHVVRLWDPGTLREQAALTAHTGVVRAVAFSPPPGRLMASASLDGTVRLWDLSGAEPKEGPVLKGQSAGVTAVAFSPNGRALAAAGIGDTTVRLWDLAGEAPREGPALKHPAPVNALAFSPEGLTLACGCADGAVRLWDLSGAEPAERPPLKGKAAQVLALVYTYRDGRKLASGTTDGLEVWDLGATEPAVRNAHDAAGKGHSRIDVLACSSDGKTLATPADFEGRLWLWDLSASVPQLRSVGTFYAQAPAVQALAFTPDGRTLAVGTDAGQVRLFEVTGSGPSEVPARKGHGSVIRAAAFAPDGRTLVSAGEDMTARLWDFGGPEALERADPLGHESPVTALAFTPDGRTLATATSLDSQGWLWDLTAAKPKERDLPRRHESTITALAFAPDGRRLASAGRDQAVHLWDLVGDSPRFITSLAHPGPVQAIAFAPDGRALAVGCDGAGLRLWDLGGSPPTLRAALEGHPGGVTAVAFGPDGRTLASGGREAAVCLWDLGGAKPALRVTLRGHQRGVTSVAFAPDGKTVASAGEDGRILIWDAAAGKTVREWQLPGRVSGLAFAPDGRHLALINADGTIYILRLAPPPQPVQ